MIDLLHALIPIVLLELVLITALIASITDRRKWNDGICKANGLRWEFFAKDSQGGRGYSAGDETVWISWPGIER